jgi:hypothetical protein
MNLVSVVVRSEGAPDVFAPGIDSVNGPEDHALHVDPISGTADSANKAGRLSHFETDDRIHSVR